MSAAESGAPPARRIRPLDLFRDGNYRRLWLTGGFVGVIRWLELLAISVFVLEVTGSVFQTALMSFFRFLPMIMLGAVMGAIGERVNRRRFMLGALCALTCTTVLLGMLAMTGQIAVWHVAIGAFLGGAMHTSEFPVRRAMLGEIAGPGRAGPALALDSVTNNGTRLLGPIGGGVLYDQVGLHGAYFLCAVLYGIGFLLTYRVHYRAAAQSAAHVHYLTNLVEGVRFVFRNRGLVGALLVTIIVNMFAVPFSAMIPVIGKNELLLSASLIGVLASSEGVGALVGAITVACLQPANFTRTYLVGSFIFLLGVGFFAGANSFAIAIAVLFVAGLGHAGFSTTQSAIMFAAATPEMRSRVLGVLATCIGGGPIGVLHLGLLADHLGAPLGIAIMVAEGVLLLILTALIWPELFRGTVIRTVSAPTAK